MFKRLSLKIYGDVQGVFYRARTKQRAEELNLVGWVRNESDGTVKIVTEGEEEKLRELIKFCYNVPNAMVEKIDAEWGEALNEFKGFSIKYDV